MKKILKFSLLVVFTIFICCGCEGDVTRALRHAGFNLSGEKFVCNAFNNDEGLTESIKYLTSTHIITDYGRIYEVSLGQTYSNDQNCRLADTELKVKSIFDDNIFRSEDGKIYRLNADGKDNAAYTLVGSTDNNYSLYYLLLGDVDVVKAASADTENGIYYVLKSDGNVYGYSVSKADRNSPATLLGSSIVYNKADYGGDIIDFGYAGESSTTYVRTSERVFHMVVDNYDECSKYADVRCTYHMEEDEVFAEQGEYIKVFNGSTIITTYDKIFTRGS